MTNSGLYLNYTSYLKSTFQIWRWLAWNFPTHPLNTSITQNDNSRQNHLVLKPTTNGLLAGNAKHYGPRYTKVKHIFVTSHTGQMNVQTVQNWKKDEKS